MLVQECLQHDDLDALAMTPEFVTLCRQWFFEHGRWSFVAPLIGHSTERYPMLNQLFHPSGTNEARRILATYLPSDRGHFNGDWKCMTEGEQSAWRTFCVKYIAPELMVRARLLPSFLSKHHQHHHHHHHHHYLTHSISTSYRTRSQRSIRQPNAGVAFVTRFVAWLTTGRRTTTFSEASGAATAT